MHRFGPMAAGLFILLCGAVGSYASLTGRLWPASWVGDALAGALLVVILGTALIPGGRRRGRGFFLGLLLVLALTVQLVLAFTWTPPPVGLVPSATLLAAGLVLTFLAEHRRRNARMRLEAGRITVRARRQDLEQVLPLDAVREVEVNRNAWARMWGFAELVALVKKGTLGKQTDRPVITERAATGALLGNGWDEEGRFVLKAVHPYKRIKRQLEHQIRLARLPPREREEAELAERLSEDLERIELESPQRDP